MSEVLDASRICNGSFGRVFIDGEWQSNVNECTATEEMDKKEVVTCGSTRTKYKRGATKGTGSIKGYHITSKMIQQGFKKFEVLTSLEDPEAYGYERIRLIGCMADKISLVNFKGGDLIEQETPFSYDDYELVDPIEAE